ncbi:hypothetical protein [Bradyrhizobium sp. S3.2.12]|jgi:hypothetical protein|uniref:hypothetical protein n=1 Tax=Bradyrhizobium sp. S3.2.12 TaxID=3156387 RepID=UPI003391B950
MTNLREQVAALRGDLDALQAKVERMPGYEKSELAVEAKGKGEVAPIEVAQIKIGAKDLIFVLATMTEKYAQQIIVQTKIVKINVAGKTTEEKATLEKEKITVPVPVPTNLGEGQLVVIDLINKDGGKFTLAYMKTNAEGLKLRGAAEQKKFRQQEGQQEDQQKG